MTKKAINESPILKTQREIDEVLKKNKCFLQVEFMKNSVMGKEVLVYEITIKENGQKEN